LAKRLWLAGNEQKYLIKLAPPDARKNGIADASAMR
jgi:hypothetical protein